MTTAPSPPAPDANKTDKRRGVVLIAVLVVVVLLSLASYQYSDMMLAEYRVAENAHRSLHAHSLAVSGVHFAAAMLSDPDNFYGPMMNGNPWNNPEVFRDVVVSDSNGFKGMFSLIAPVDPSDTSSGPVAFGVMDEGGKINLNALMKLDPKGDKAHEILLKLPNMTEELVAAIIDWMDPDSDTRPGGAEDDYYSGLTPPYRAKNGAIDSIDELLLVKGVTRELLYGNDTNRNGIEDPNEGGPSGFSRGWSAFLTVHSREQNSDPDGKPFIFLNNADLSQLQSALADTEVDENLAKFIIMYRQYPTADSQGATISFGGGILTLMLGGSSTKSSGNKTVDGDLGSYEVKLTKKGNKEIKSMFDLVNTQVKIPGKKDAKGIQTDTIYRSPLNDVGQMRELFPKLFAVATLTDPVLQSEMTPRININTAPAEVLATLPDLTDVELEKILSLRPSLSSGDALGEPIYQTPTWLLSEAEINIANSSARPTRRAAPRRPFA